MIDLLNAKGILRNLLVVSHDRAEPTANEMNFIKDTLDTFSSLGLNRQDLVEDTLDKNYFIPEDINDRIKHLVVVFKMMDTFPGEEIPDEKLEALYEFSNALGFSGEEFVNISNHYEINKDNFDF